MPKRYWANFRELRLQKGLSQEEVARRLDITRQGNLPARELHDMRVPGPATIRRHARALECDPSELLREVQTTYDLLRHMDDRALKCLDIFVRLDEEAQRTILRNVAGLDERRGAPTDDAAQSTPPQPVVSPPTAHGSRRKRHA